MGQAQKIMLISLGFFSLNGTPYRNTAAVLAFLDLIAYSEGTYFHGDKGYKLCFAYRTFTSFDQHPGRIVRSFSGKRRIASSAAGRYQLLSSTWREIQRILRLPDFSPESQDRAALFLLDRYNALDDILSGYITRAIAKVNRIWASLPGSPYGQPTKILESLLIFYYDRLKFYQLER